MRIKICGITRLEDARAAAGLGVDALGFIFTPKSPRYISPLDASEIIKRLPPFVSRVGVFVDEDPRTLIDTVQTAGIDTIQLHGSEPPEYCAAMPAPVIKALPVSNDFDLSLISKYKNVTAGILLDTWDPNRKGGSGRTFDWQIAIDACRKCDSLILSGGLGPLNIQKAIETVTPYAVDLNSGVESAPGVKNHTKMREVVAVVRKFDG
ncbi:MAG: phosphoribosylanthranilate isomerase [Chitinispirillia bacterium]|nr:phosphoribosylanthranilate isomerase [Chitinispirillia bacterium]MCL2267823.1 phosphoribosylanthranilate isomerase [Chitinispirillia bacterium]